MSIDRQTVGKTKAQSFEIASSIIENAKHIFKIIQVIETRFPSKSNIDFSKEIEPQYFPANEIEKPLIKILKLTNHNLVLNSLISSKKQSLPKQVMKVKWFNNIRESTNRTRQSENAKKQPTIWLEKIKPELLMISSEKPIFKAKEEHNKTEAVKKLLDKKWVKNNKNTDKIEIIGNSKTPTSSIQLKFVPESNLQNHRELFKILTNFEKPIFGKLKSNSVHALCQFPMSVK